MSSKRGFAPIFIILVLGIFGLIATANLSSNQSVNRTVLVSSSLIAEHGSDDSNKESEQQPVQTQNPPINNQQESGDNNSGSGSPSSGGSGSSGGNNNPTNTKQINSTLQKRAEVKTEKAEVKQEKTEKVEKTEVKTDLKNEIENELEKPETAEVEVKDVNGELEVEVKDATGSSRTVGRQKGKNTKLALEITSKGKKQEIKLKVENDKFELESEGESAQTNFPISVDKTSAGLIVNTPNGPKAIRLLPDQASIVARSVGILNNIQKIELIENEVKGTADDLVFKSSGVKPATLLGLIPLEIPLDIEVGAQTGTLIGTHEPTIFRILASFIR